MRFRGVFFSLLLASGVCFMTLEAQTQTGAYGQSGSSGAAQGTSSQGAARTTTNSQKNSQSSSSQSSQTSQQSSMSSQSSTKLSSADQNFVKKAMQDGMAEVELGNLAEQNASSKDVKDLGKKIAEDHSRANEELQKIASNSGYTPEAVPDKTHQQTKDKFSKLSGADFDRQFVNQMVKDHQSAIAAFERESRSGNNAEVKQFASVTVPKLQEHLKLAQEAQQKLGNGSSTTSKTQQGTGTGAQGLSQPGNSGQATGTQSSPSGNASGTDSTSGR